MGLGDWFRRMFSSGSERAEKAAAMHEGFGAPDEGEVDLKRVEETGGGGGTSGLRFGASEAAEAAEDDLASEEAPPDPAP